MAPHSSTLARKIPWTEEPRRLQSMGSLRVGHDWATSLSLFNFMHWRRKWQPTPVFLPGESQGQRSLVGRRLWVAQSRTRLKWLSSSRSSVLMWGLVGVKTSSRLRKVIMISGISSREPRSSSVIFKKKKLQGRFRHAESLGNLTELSISHMVWKQQNNSQSSIGKSRKGLVWVVQTVKNPLAMQETQVWSLGPEDAWRKAWQVTPVFLPGEFHGQRNLAGYSP